LKFVNEDDDFMGLDEGDTFKEIFDHLMELKGKVKINYSNFKKMKAFIDYRE